MKNVCVIVKNRITLDDEGANVLLNAFSAQGYSFDEARILPFYAQEKLKNTIVALKTEYENILLLASKEDLPFVAELVRGIFSKEGEISVFEEAKICVEKKRSLFLLSADGEGLTFVKSACIPHLRQKYETRYETLTVCSIGANEARVRALLAEATRRGEGKVRFWRNRRFDEERITIVYDDQTPKMTIDEIVRIFVDGLGDTVYALTDSSIEEQLLALLKLRGKKLSVAESFTGGGIAKRITSVSGASEVYFEGVNTYNEGSKIDRLSVSEFTLRTSGAVSDETAYQMALGLLKTGNCDISIATTGLAGPKTDRSALPVGLCFIAIGTKEKIFVYRYKFDGDRKEITEKAINYALHLAYKQLKNV